MYFVNKKIIGAIVLFFFVMLLGTNLFSQNPEFEPGKILIKFKSGIVMLPEGADEAIPGEVVFASSLVDSILIANNFSKIEKLFKNFDPTNLIQVNPAGDTAILVDLSNNFKIILPETVDILSLVEKLSALEEVEYAEPNYIYRLCLEPDDPLFGSQWHLKNTGQGEGTPGEDIQATKAWDRTTGSGDVKIGILDSGIDFYNTDMGGAPIPNSKVIYGYDFHTGSPNAMDYYGHGTSVAGLASAITDNTALVAGVSWGSSLLAMKVGETGVYTDAAVAAINECINQGVRVINNSWGGPNYSTTLAQVLRNAFLSGTSPVIACAMGNQGSETIRYPAAYHGTAFAVSAWTKDGVRWEYSNYGWWNDITAPGGEEITTTDLTSQGGYRTNFGGTSAATPIVSGVAALLISYNSTLTNDDVQEVITRTARDDDYNPGYDPYYGWGKINADSALWFICHPRTVLHASTGNVYTYGDPVEYWMFLKNFPVLVDNPYIVRRYEVRTDVTFPRGYFYLPDTWVRAVGTNGWRTTDEYDYLMEVPWGEVVPGSLTPNGCSFRTYVYDVYDFGGDPCGWYPCSPSEVAFAYSVLGEVALQIPTNFMAVAKILEGEIKLSWDDNNLNELGYEIERKDATNNEWIQIAATDSNVAVYWDANIMGSETYWYHIRAYNQNQTSAWSPDEQEKNYPNPPRNLRASVTWTDCDFGGFGGVGTMGVQPSCPTNEVTLTWDAPANQKPNTIAYYTIYAWDDDDWYQIWSPVYSTQRVVCLPELFHTYHFEVNTVDYADDISRDSNQADRITGWEWICEPDWPTPGKMVLDEKIRYESFSLHQNYPNPFNSKTQIRFDLPVDCKVSLQIYNISGQMVKTLINSHMAAGHKTVYWDGTDNRGITIASGIYFYKLDAGEFVALKKMVLMK